jgi:signal transduction histidine kinase
VESSPSDRGDRHETQQGQPAPVAPAAGGLGPAADPTPVPGLPVPALGGRPAAPRRARPRRLLEGAVAPWSQLPDTQVREIVPLELDQEAPAPPLASDGLVAAVEEMRDLAELGSLSARVAHLVSDALAGIAATAEVLRDTLEPGDDRGEGVDVILREVRRLDDLLRNLLTLAHGRSPRPMPADIADDLGRVARALRADATSAAVALELELPDACTPVLVDSELIQHAFLHVARNAIEAMPRGGTLTMRMRVPEAGSGFVCVEFADTGDGIERTVLPRIFEPFYSTRAGGVGLGLAAARKLVERQGGHIAVESRPGQGACFTFYLRRADQVASD